ncbi:MAG: helix-hairpin-helix domain-containing protein [Desulfocapsa sp.]|nr:helix-hairpin-helix domain-containing protein [Desulfocapsa sp.]
MKRITLVLLTLMFLAVNVALAAVNINTADKETLASLPGIGDVKAEAIIQYRNDHGEFKNAQDLVNVKGIGPNILEKLAKDITIK